MKSKKWTQNKRWVAQKRKESHALGTWTFCRDKPCHRARLTKNAEFIVHRASDFFYTEENSFFQSILNSNWKPDEPNDPFGVLWCILWCVRLARLFAERCVHLSGTIFLTDAGHPIYSRLLRFICLSVPRGRWMFWIFDAWDVHKSVR